MPDALARGIQLLAFDCYGTLIDWQTGILAAARPILTRHRLSPTDSEVIRAFAAAERSAESGPYRSYKVVLEGVMAALCPAPLTPGEREALWRSIPHWPAFVETPAALTRLASAFPLAVLSNIDDDLFDSTRPRLGVPLAHVITAQQVRSYKPGTPHFTTILARTGLAPSEVLHIAESRFHDIEPAAALGMRTVWVNRTGAAPSASGPGSGVANHTAPSLTALADALVD